MTILWVEDWMTVKVSYNLRIGWLYCDYTCRNGLDCCVVVGLDVVMWEEVLIGWLYCDWIGQLFCGLDGFTMVGRLYWMAVL